MKRRACTAAFLSVATLLWAGAAQAALPDTIARLKGSVLLVGTFRATDSPRFQLRGTGFLVGDGRTVVTNVHVLSDSALVVQVRKANEEGWETRAVSVLGIDEARDLALLRMEGPPGQAMRVGDSSRVREGDTLAFMGFPIGGLLGYSTVTHRALVSSITASPLPALQAAAGQRATGGTFDVFQLDATAYPGNSGGPLFDPATGDVLGVMSMVLINSSTPESALSQPSGISYAIPSRHISELLARYR